MQETFSLPINKPCDGALHLNDSARLGKRKLPFPSSLHVNESRMMTNKKRKKGMRFADNNVAATDSNFSIDLDIPTISDSSSDNEDIFKWMDSLLGKGNDETPTMLPSFDEIENIGTTSNVGHKSDDIEFGPFLRMGEYDSCYDEMLSLLAQHDDQEENVFKKIKESFVSDRLLDHHPFTSTSSRTSDDFAKSPALKRSPSFNNHRSRSSRIGMREALDQFYMANRLTSKTRQMLLNCKLSFYKNNTQ